MGVPNLPSHPKNPVGQTALYREASAAWTKHIRPLRKMVREWLDQVPTRVIESNSGRFVVNRYEFLIDPETLNQFIDDLLSRVASPAVNRTVWEKVRASYEQGTGDEVINLQGITDGLYERDVLDVIQSDQWQRRVGLVRARVFEEMRGFEGETGRELARVLRDGVSDGRNPLDIASDVSERFDVSQSRARRIARTEVTGAYRRARWDEDADAKQRLGISTGLMHLSARSPTTRKTHRDRHGHIYSQDEVRQWYSRDGNSINCYLPGTKVRGRFVAGSKAHYSGKAFRIVTAGGRDISVTPNHPVMTDRGLIAAAEITESDNLVAYVGQAEDLSGVGDLNGNLIDARVEDVFCSIKDLGHSDTARVSGVDFHGDGAFINEDVEIVDMDGVLTLGGEPPALKFLDDLKFILADPVTAANRPLALGLNGVPLAPSRLMGVAGNFLSVFGRGVLKPLGSASASVSIFKAPILKPSVQCNSGNACISADGENGFPGHVAAMKPLNVKGVSLGHVSGEPSRRQVKTVSDKLEVFSGPVALDRVVNVEVSDYCGHVYDLQEVSGLMVANDIITSNCKCSQVSVLLDENGEPANPDFVKRVRDKAQG